MAENVSWGSSTAGNLVIQGLIAPLSSAILTLALTALFGPDFSSHWPIYLAVAGIIGLLLFLVLSFARAKLRRVIWGPVVVAYRWVRGLRLETARTRGDLFEAGYAARSEELASERARSPRPSWRVDRRTGTEDIYLYNAGYWVEDVTVQADPDFFVFDGTPGSAFLAGRLGDNSTGSSTGAWLRGTVTDRGKREGVDFTVSWRDQNGDQKPLPGESNAIVRLPAVPRSHVSRPTWQIGRPKEKSSPEIYLLVNGSSAFKGTEVVIDADPTLFTFILKRELGDLEGLGGLRFAGRPTEAGRVLGVTFQVTYRDANGDSQTDLVPVEFGL